METRSKRATHAPPKPWRRFADLVLTAMMLTLFSAEPSRALTCEQRGCYQVCCPEVCPPGDVCICTAAPLPAGTSCEDRIACNGGDTCDSVGYCSVHAGPNTCPTATFTATRTPTSTQTPSPTSTPTSTPTPRGLCNVAPRSDCKLAEAGASSLMLAAPGDPAKSKLVWRWKKGAETLSADLGDPRLSTQFRLCLYDGSGTLMPNIPVPPAAMCGPKPCWKPIGKKEAPGFAYADPHGVAGGITLLKLLPGADGKASLVVKAKGRALTMPPLPLLQIPGPVVVQLVNDSTPACWRADFSAPSLTPADDLGRWKDTND